SSLYSSAHISIKAVAGIKWSSGNEAKSLKHSLIMGVLSNASRLL
ncbi:unnamed protein product, partial [Linum tenue]